MRRCWCSVRPAGSAPRVFNWRKPSAPASLRWCTDRRRWTSSPRWEPTWCCRCRTGGRERCAITRRGCGMVVRWCEAFDDAIWVLATEGRLLVLGFAAGGIPTSRSIGCCCATSAWSASATASSSTARRAPSHCSVRASRPVCGRRRRSGIHCRRAAPRWRASPPAEWSARSFWNPLESAVELVFARLTATKSLRYNKRLRKLAPTIAWLIGVLGADTSVGDDDLWVVDSTPVECARSTETVKRSDLAGWAQYGYCASHSRYFWGLRLHLLCTVHGLPLGWALTGAKADERDVLIEILSTTSTLVSNTRESATIIGDKNYYGRAFEATLADQGITLLRPARKGETPSPGHRFFKPLRQIIESVNDTLKPIDLQAAPSPGLPMTRILALTAAIWHTTARPQTRGISNTAPAARDIRFVSLGSRREHRRDRPGCAGDCRRAGGHRGADPARGTAGVRRDSGVGRRRTQRGVLGDARPW